MPFGSSSAWSGLCCASCIQFVDVGDGRNLFGAVELAGRWYLTAYPATGWQRSWFSSPIGDGPTVTPDFAVAGANVAAPDIVDGATTYRCVGVSGSQYGDASRVPPGSESCVWYQLNYRPVGDTGSQPVAALARVAVRDDAISSQIGSPLNRKFELTHCWLLKDENGDPWYFDAEEKLCHYHGTSLKTLTGPGHFAYQYLRQSGDVNRLRYWTPGVAEAVVTEWDNPNVVINASGWQALFFDATAFPVALGTRASTITTGATQTGHRDLICGMGNPASGVVNEVEEWTDEGDSEGTQHLRVGSEVGGTGGSWPTLTQDHLAIEVNDFGFCGAASDFEKESPDEFDSYTVAAFANASNHNAAGRYKCQWGAQTFQRSTNQRFDIGIGVDVDSDPIPAKVLKVIAGGGGPTDFPIAGVRGNYRVSAGADGSAAIRIAGVTTNSWCGYSSAAPTVTDYLGNVIEGAGATGHGEHMYAYSGFYLFEKAGEGANGDALSVPAPTFSEHTTAEPVFRDGLPTWKEDSLGWYLESIPPKIRALVRLPAAIDITPESEAGEWFAWVISQSHASITTPITFDGALPGWQKALLIAAAAPEDDDIYVKIQGVYWPTSGEPEEAPRDSFAYAGVHA
jgi:hypothetical protein